MRDALEREREAARARMCSLEVDFAEVVEASRDSNADDEHDPEGATIAFERSQLATLVHATSERLHDIEAAITRLEAGDYGRCARCGGVIPAARLVARPTARTCVHCPPV